MSQRDHDRSRRRDQVQEQVILPWRMALRITLRGLKIRLGRSLITVSGVVLGIAFLMSVLTSEGLRGGLADENRTKTEVTRLLKLVEEEIGTLKGRKISIIASEEGLGRHLERLLQRMAEDADEGSLFVHTTESSRFTPPGPGARDALNGPAYAHTQSLDELFRDSHLLLLLHQDAPWLVSLIEKKVDGLAGRKLAVLTSSSVTDPRKLRLLEGLAARVGPGGIWVFATDAEVLAPRETEAQAELTGDAYTHTRDPKAFFEGADLLLLLDGDLPHLTDLGLAGHLASMKDQAVVLDYHQRRLDEADFRKIAAGLSYASLDESPLLPYELLEKHMPSMRQPVILDYYHGRYSLGTLQKLDENTLYTSLSYRMTEEEARAAKRRARRETARKVWITIISVLVTVIGITNAMLMSVTERVREIGTMKCLGALSEFVVKLFLIESFIIGTIGAVLGTLLGFVVPFLAYMLSTGVSLLLRSTPYGHLFGYGIASLFAGTLLAILAAIYPAVVAAKMVPADALRTNV